MPTRYSAGRLYLDTGWLADLQAELGLGGCGFRRFSPILTRDPLLRAAFRRLHAVLIDDQADHLQKHSAAVEFFSALHRRFKKHYGMTPHAHLTNRRVQFARAELRRGGPIAEVALAADLADQAYLQRAFKQLLAATPRHYCGQRRA